MKNVLIISSGKNSSDMLSDFIKSAFSSEVRITDSVQQAKAILSGSQNYDFVLINTPLKEGNEFEFAKMITNMASTACCIMFVSAAIHDKYCSYADQIQLLLVPKPFSKQMLYYIIKAADLTIQRSWTLHEENIRLENKIEEIKQVDRAKFMLMEFCSMTEEEAHAYIGQYAMKQRKKKTAAAMEIIDRINEQYL